MKIRYTLGILFLLIQVASIVYARFIPERFFCWAPYDSQSKYEIIVTVNGEKLSEEDIKARYHYKANSWEERAIGNIFSYIESYESTYGKHDNAKVVVKYATNGKSEQIWTLP